MPPREPQNSTSRAALMCFIATLDLADSGTFDDPAVGLTVEQFLSRWQTLITEVRELRPYQVDELIELVGLQLGVNEMPDTIAGLTDE